jgi:hypothetical protein
LAGGDISEDEAEVVADAAAKNPDAEDGLLGTAKNPNKSHDDLKKRAADAKASAETDTQRADRLRRGRRAGWGTDRDGFWTLTGRFQPQVGAELKARLDTQVDTIVKTARAAGRREPFDRYRADAVAALIGGSADPGRPTGPPTGRAAGSARPSPTTGSGRRSAPDRADPPNGGGADGQLDLDLDPHPGAAPAANPATDPATDRATDGQDGRGRPGRELVLDINLEALRRGCVRPGETCAIRGIGPVPVEVARSWVDDAFIKAVIRDGTDVKTVAHYGRHIPAPVRTALDLLDTTCAVPGCSTPRTEYDHDHPYAHGGATSLTNLRPLCPHHHRQRTHHGYQLTGEPGDRRWTDPHGQVLFADNPHHPTTEPARGP